MSTLTITQASCADDYDPDSMPVAKARAFIHQVLQPGVGECFVAAGNRGRQLVQGGAGDAPG